MKIKNIKTWITDLGNTKPYTIAFKTVDSLYRWEGRLERSSEVQLMIKSHASCASALEEAVLELHSYSTPQWLLWPAEASSDYAAWLSECCTIS